MEETTRMANAKNNANIPNVEWMIQAGLNPKTGLPVKAESAQLSTLMDGVKKALRIVDEQNAVNRYTWYNLPDGLTGQMIERIIYYRGQAALFYIDELEKFFFLPYALEAPENSTGIDIYGRYTGITPLTFNGTWENGKYKDKVFIQGMIKKPVYEVMSLDKVIEDNAFFDGAVILNDYTQQQSQTLISRQQLDDPIVCAEAEAFPFARTALLANSGIKGMRVNDQSAQDNVKAASQSLTRAALTGDPWVPIVGNIEFQDLTSGSIPQCQEYLLYMQSLDNFRLSLMGLSTGGIFQKTDHMLQSEQDMNAQNNSLVYQDGLTIRQRFCDIVNSIWGLGIWCDASEIASNQDQNGDGLIQDRKDQSGTAEGDQPEGGAI